jgi:hypothetical protein
VKTAPVEPDQAVIATRARAIPRPSGSAAPIGCDPAPPPRGVNRQLSKLGARENADHPAAGESRRLTTGHGMHGVLGPGVGNPMVEPQ